MASFDPAAMIARFRDLDDQDDAIIGSADATIGHGVRTLRNDLRPADQRSS